MTIKTLSFKLFFILSLLRPAALSAQEGVVFYDDSVIKRVAPKHFFLGPKTPGETDRLHSGYVELSFMVNELGTPENISIVHSSHSRFDKNAIAALKRYEFEPAKIGEKIVPSKSREKVFFDTKVPTVQRRSGRRLSGGRKDGETTPMFYELHATFAKLSSEERPDAARMQRLIISMARLHTLDTIAQTYLSMARYLLSVQQGQLNDQVRALTSVLYFNSKIRLNYHRLEEGKLEALEGRLQKVLIEANQLAEARENQVRLIKTRPQIASQFSPAMQSIEAMREQKKPFVRSVVLDERGLSFQLLLHRGFELQNIDGALDRVAIRCEAKFLKLDFKIGSYISLPEAWGECEVELIGSPGTLLEFIEG